REAAVVVDRDHDRRRRALLHVLRRSVELLAELHDVHAVLTERRAHRRARVRHPGGHLELDIGFYLPCHRSNPRRSNLLYLSEIELDRRRASEDLHGDPHLVLLVVDLLDDAVEVVERTVDHAHDLARLEKHFRPRLVPALLDAVEDGHRLSLADRGRPVAAPADEAENLRHLFHEMPSLVVLFHLYEHITREEDRKSVV